MPVIALAEALPDFGGATRKAATSAADAFDFAPPSPSTAAMGETPRREDDGPSADEHIATEKEALRAELEAAHASEIEALRAGHAAQMAATETRMGAELGALVTVAMADAERRLVETTADTASRILGMALTGKVEERAIEALARAIEGAVSDTDAVRIVIRGAPHLFEAVKAALGTRAEHLEFHESDALDLTVSIDEKVFETRISEWSAALAEVLA